MLMHVMTFYFECYTRFNLNPTSFFILATIHLTNLYQLCKVALKSSAGATRLCQEVYLQKSLL